MHTNSKAQAIINELCKKLHSSELAHNLKGVSHAQTTLEHLQKTEILKKLQCSAKKLGTSISSSSSSPKISHLILETEQRVDTAQPNVCSISGAIGEESTSIHTPEEGELSHAEYETEKSLECEDLSDDAWKGFFNGYDILKDNQELALSENKPCIELSFKDDHGSLEFYLRAGIYCFMIDLFVGTEVEKQRLVFQLRDTERQISREYGSAIKTTLFAMMSPRLQYTGIMAASSSTESLVKGDYIILTTKREYSATGSTKRIYVNARFLLEDCKAGDFILVGPSIQLSVTEVFEEEIKCLVMEPGLLTSRLPVLFPVRCKRSQVSLEELEDITFAREVGINVLVCYKPGTQQYLDDLYNTLSLLKCDNLRIFTRLVLNEYDEEDRKKIDWTSENYEGFLVEPSFQQYSKCCPIEEEGTSNISNMLNLSPVSVSLLTKIYNMKKPIILNASLIAERKLSVKPCNYLHIFNYPDNFLFSKENCSNAFGFYLLQNAESEDIPLMLASRQPFYDPSELGHDTIARSCVAASFESDIKVIVVCSDWPDMAIKLSHFRPKAPIVLVSATKSIGDYISLYHRIIFENFPARNELKFSEYVTNAFMFCLNYLTTRNILHNGDSLLFVYASNADTHFCDKYFVYKFQGEPFNLNLEKMLFA